MFGFFVLIFIAFVLFMIIRSQSGISELMAHVRRHAETRRTTSDSSSTTTSTTSSDDSSSSSSSLFDNKRSEAEIQHEVAVHGLNAHGEALVRHHGMDGATAALHSGSNNDPHDPTKGGGGFGGGGIGGI